MAYVPMLLQLVVAVRMIWTRLYARFPFFFVYTVVHVITIAVMLYALRLSQLTYFYTYWTCEILDIFLSLAVIQELFKHAFQPFEALKGLSGLIFRWATLVLCGISIISGSISPGKDAARIMAAMLVLVRSSNFVLTALLALLFALAAFFGVKWQRTAFTIAAGLGVMAAIDASVIAIRSEAGEIAHPMYSLIAPLAYNLACGFWVYGAFAKTRKVELDAHDTGKLMTWNRALQEVIHR